MVSHAHIDHINDLAVVIGAMTTGYSVRKGILITNVSVSKKIKQSIVFGPAAKCLDKVIPLRPGQKLNLNTIEVLATGTKHNDRSCIGFVIKGSKQVSYVADTGYFPELSEWHKNSEVLILNVLRPNGQKVKYQMNCDDAIALVSEVKPKLAIFTHLGKKMKNPDAEAKTAADKTGTKVIAARDGLCVNL